MNENVEIGYFIICCYKVVFLLFIFQIILTVQTISKLKFSITPILYCNNIATPIELKNRKKILI